MLEGFFRDLGGRLYKENDLSDVTWAMARNCEVFLKVFADFFNFDFNPDQPTEINREDSLGESGRPDFSIENGDAVFLIESKIYDRNYHIEQYGKLKFLREREIRKLGLVTNHRIDEATRAKAKDNNFTDPRTWEEFTTHLENKLRAKSFPEEWEDIIKGYIEYVKEVCSIMELKEIRFDTLISLFYFNRLVKKTIEEFNREGFEVNFCKFPRANGENWSGQYFSLKKKEKKEAIYPFLGIYYGEEPPTIYIAFEKDWSKNIYLKYRGKKKEEDYFYIETDDWEVSFCLNESKFERFNKVSLEEQEMILKNFLGKVIDEISQYL
ncbi:MAG: hypothetical protein ABSG71_20620 [Thermodesulfobacteriota bacterium]|jgi:hypothetical protein